ncbi:MAG: CHRD domain-containing protein [Ginsengibacter sp.]
MKTRSITTKWLLAVAFVLFGMVALNSCKKKSTTDNRPYTLKGDAAGSQVVPPVTGNGTGTFNGTYDPSTHTMTYTTNWTGLSGGATSGGFYTGASGSAGTAVGDPWTLPADSTGAGTYSGTMTLTDEQASQLTSGNWYYSYGTVANPGGEIRGQITATR